MNPDGYMICQNGASKAFAEKSASLAPEKPLMTDHPRTAGTGAICLTLPLGIDSGIRSVVWLNDTYRGGSSSCF